MKNYKYTKIISLLLILALLVTTFAVGCMPSRKPINYTPGKPGTTYNEVRDNKIASELSKISGIRHATVLTNGGTAYVGLDIAPNIEAARTVKIKDEAIAKTKYADKTITKVYVSSDVGVITRLKKYVQDIKAGKPISGLVAEIEEMFRRVVPTT